MKKSLNIFFNAFEQQNNQDVAKYGGTGLGLYNLYKIGSYDEW